MSGSNRLINSKNTLEGNSQSRLKTELMDGNNQAVTDTEEGISTKYPYKKGSVTNKKAQ